MNLKKNGRNAIKMFGSRFSEELGWRSTWAFISKKRAKWLAESLQKSPSFNEWASPVVVQANVQLLDKESNCNWGTNDAAVRRKQFCGKYEGYGSVCSCECPIFWKWNYNISPQKAHIYGVLIMNVLINKIDVCFCRYQSRSD